MENFNEDEFSNDMELTESYRNQLVAMETKVNLMLSTTERKDEISSVVNETKRNFRLPKLELKRFDGNFKNWLGFWGQFKKIHDDDSIDADDKFQYFLQATEDGLSARDLVASFPPFGEKIEQLKSRFAKDELLIQIYVRELLNLVLTQAKSGENFTLRILYDKLETQLRALETSGVTSEKYEAMLYPLVESALPEALIKEWERTHNRVENKDKMNMLGNLLEFLRLEVESEERLKLARSGFANDQFEKFKTKEKIPTAACIVSNEKQRAEKNDKHCLFCNKSFHNTSECFKAAEMSLDAKRETLKKRRACFRYVSKYKSIKTRQKVSESDAQVLLSPKNSPTLLLTVLVKIINGDKSGIVRGLFDTGAQRSFIRKDIAEKLGLKLVDQEMMSHGLFGGSETKQESHNVYNITLQSLCSNFKYTISVLDEKKICGAIPRVEDPDIYPILKKKNIRLSDTGEYVPEIGLLIGADYLGALLTGRIEPIDNNLVAIKTKLGWTLQGKQRNYSKSLESIVYANNLDLTELCSLDVIGIRCPAEVKSKQVTDEETVDFFLKTIKRNEDKRYEVCLPWKSGRPELETNKELATKRLMSTTKNFIRSGHLREYDDVFNEWVRDGIIEIVDKDKKKGHYLPHHPVIKTGVTTTKIRPVFDASTKDSKGNSLNNCLEKGPNLLELVPKLIMQFRKNAIGVTSDIKKAFLQISLNRRDESASTNMPLRPAANDSDSSEDDDSSPKVSDFVTRAGRRVKIPNRL
ncbi:uncharacterized protein LOC118180329, partial [Stegodyphus dumicola]|uniref:uncharacterized protein LOC118180329 n=1 Tax=Stegodyphus dumicola TaxID=202533 RepID=UPI0015B2BAF6